MCIIPVILLRKTLIVLLVKEREQDEISAEAIFYLLEVRVVNVGEAPAKKLFNKTPVYSQ